jgi:hypothetical protein
VLLVVLRVAGVAPAETPATPNDYDDDDEFVPVSEEGHFDVFDWQLCKVREEPTSTAYINIFRSKHQERRRLSLFIIVFLFLFRLLLFLSLFHLLLSFSFSIPRTVYSLLISYSVFPFSFSLLHLLTFSSSFTHC